MGAYPGVGACPGHYGTCIIIINFYQTVILILALRYIFLLLTANVSIFHQPCMLFSLSKPSVAVQHLTVVKQIQHVPAEMSESVNVLQHSKLWYS